MDYSGFYEFPFPSVLNEKDTEAKNRFLSLSDEEQLKLLNGSKSYEEFHNRIMQHMNMG